MVNEPGAARGPRASRYRRIYDQLREQILAGQYRPGDRLPTEMELAALHGVSRTTSATALAELARDGLVERAPRRGTVVRSLRSSRGPRPRPGSRPLIAWIQPHLDYPFGVPVLRGVEQAAREAGYTLLLTITETSLQAEEQAIREALISGAVGIALFPQDGESFSAEVLRLVVDRFPVVLVDRHFRGVACASASSDNVAGARAVVEELTRAGHRHICAVVLPALATSTIEDRLDGYAQALAAVGVPLDPTLIFEVAGLRGVNVVDDIPPVLVEQFADYLGQRQQVTAIFASNAPLALLTLRATERLGLCIPHDVSIVCIDALHTLPFALPCVTYARQPAVEIGRVAVGLIAEQLAGQPSRRIILPMEVERGASVAPPRRPD